MFAALALLMPSLTNWKIWAGVGAAIALVALVWSWDAKIRESAILEVQNATLQGNIAVLQQEAQLAQAAQVVAEKRLAEATAQTIQIDRITQEAHNAPSTEDGPLSVVLRRALSELGSLQHPAASR